jgi:predicted acyl esterase
VTALRSTSACSALPAWNRVSARHLDETLSTGDIPAHSFDQVNKFSVGQIVDIEIDLLPIGLAFRPGEQLRFVISGRNLLGTLMPAIREYAGANSGRRVIDTGGKCLSYLQLPVER